MVVGNKADFGDAIRQVSTEEGQQFASRNGLLFVETSAKDVDKVEQAFTTLTNAAFSQIINQSTNNNNNPTSISVVRSPLMRK